jgi:hypothetical protein
MPATKLCPEAKRSSLRFGGLRKLCNSFLVFVLCHTSQNLLYSLLSCVITREPSQWHRNTATCHSFQLRRQGLHAGTSSQTSGPLISPSIQSNALLRTNVMTSEAGDARRFRLLFQKTDGLWILSVSMADHLSPNSIEVDVAYLVSLSFTLQSSTQRFLRVLLNFRIIRDRNGGFWPRSYDLDEHIQGRTSRYGSAPTLCRKAWFHPRMYAAWKRVESGLLRYKDVRGS